LIGRSLAHYRVTAALGTGGMGESLPRRRFALTLARDLLAKGERQAVIQYLESLPRFWQGRREAIDEWAILIRAGQDADLNRFLARRVSGAASATPQ